MYEYMFWNNFMFIVAGLFMAIIFIFVGICIGGCIDRNNKKEPSTESISKSTASKVRDGFDYSSVHNCRTNYVNNSSMGNVHREVDSGCDMGYAPSTEEIIIVLNALPYTARLSSYERDCVERAANVIELLLGFIKDEK